MDASTSTASCYGRAVAARARSSAPPRAHHYIPRFLLKGFAPGLPGERKRRTLARYDKRTGKLQRLSTKHAAVVNHFYTLPPEAWHKADALEHSFAWLEGMVARHVEWLRSLSAPGRYRLDPTIRDGLAGFVAMLHVRSPAYREWADRRINFLESIRYDMQLANPEAVRDALRASGDTRTDDEIEAYRLQELDEFRSGRVFLEALPIASMGDLRIAVDAIRPQLIARRWVVVRRDRWPLLVIGDQPVTLVGPTGELGEIGFGIAENEILVPLGSNALLVMTGEPDRGGVELVTPDRTDPAGLEGPWWHQANAAAWGTADRFVFARSRADLDAVALALDPEKRQGRPQGLSFRGPAAWAGYAERLGIRHEDDDGPLVSFHATDPNPRDQR